MDVNDQVLTTERDGPSPIDPPAAPQQTEPYQHAETLDLILDELRAIRREDQHRDFSLWHLAGAIAQAFALCATLWAIIVLIDARPDAHAVATIRFLAAIVFQLMALTGFAAPRKH